MDITLIRYAKENFKQGDRIICSGRFGNNYRLFTDIKGTILYIEYYNNHIQNLLIEFDVFIDGHNGKTIGVTSDIQGKKGFCWWCNEFLSYKILKYRNLFGEEV